MNTADLTLLIPEKPDPEREDVARAWRAGGGTVLPIGRFWDPPSLDTEQVRLYGSETFCLILAEKLGLELISPADDLVTTLERELLGREVRAVALSEIDGVSFPAFVKSLLPKQIPSRVYSDSADLEGQTKGLDPAAVLMVSGVIDIAAEARCFVLNGAVLDCAFYEGEGDIESARALGADVARRSVLPPAVVVDVAATSNGSWVVIEFNAAWGAGLNGCAAEAVLPVIEAASRAQAASS